MAAKFTDEGFPAKRVPLSGAARFHSKTLDGDVQVSWNGATLYCEVKSRRGGAGFKTLETWLGGADFMLLIRNHADPMAVIPWKTLVKLLRGQLIIKVPKALAGTYKPARPALTREGARDWLAKLSPEEIDALRDNLCKK